MHSLRQEATVDFLFTSLVTGAAFGLVAYALDKGRQEGPASNIILGLIGGFLGGWLLSAADVIKLGGVEGDVIRAGAGAALLLFAAKMFR